MKNTLPARRCPAPFNKLHFCGTVCRGRLAALAGLAVSSAFLAEPNTHAAAPSLPSGAQTVAGVASVSQSGTTLTVTQSTARAVTNWQSFNIGAGHTVNFVQPSASAVSLNRVIGNDVSVIQGALNANGHVFLLNPNGVLFTSSAQVNVGGIVASTLSMKTEDFMAGRYTFEGAGSGTIVNQGKITAAKGGMVGLIAAKLTNTGSIVAPEGSVIAGAGNRVTLDLGGPVKIKVEEGVLEALIEQGGAIRADGGLVYLTAKAAGEVTRTVINHTGITEAKTLSAGKDGKIYLMGGKEKDRIVVAGKLDASAPDEGNGGFVETSAANVQIADEARVSTLSKQGKNGTWLIDPTDFEITSGVGGLVSSNAAAGNSIGATTLGIALNSGNVTIQTAEEGEGFGDITVSAPVTRTADFEEGTTTLTLAAHRNVLVYSGISGSVGAPLNIVIAARATGGYQGSIRVNADLRSFGGNITLGGGDLQASDFAIGHDAYPGIRVLINKNIDATSTGSSAGSSGAAERTSVLPTALTGGRITLRGTGAVEEQQQQGSGIILLGNNSIVTSGDGAISIEGRGGSSFVENDARFNSAGMVLSSSVYIKANTGQISLTGNQGFGNGRFGIAVNATSSEPLFIGTNAGISIQGDSLAILAGEMKLYSVSQSTIEAPVVGGNTGNTPYALTKTGLGALSFFGSASGWVPPENTSPTKTTGTFSDAHETLFGGEVTRAQALFAFHAIAAPSLPAVVSVPSATLDKNTQVKSALNSVYVVPPVVSRPASAQLNVGLQLVEVAPAAKGQSNGNASAASSAFSFDPVAAAKRAPGTVLVLTGGVKRAADDADQSADKKNDSKR